MSPGCISPGGPKLVCVDLTRDEVVQTILFPPDVALPTTYLNDVRFDLRRGETGAAFITDSSDQGPNGIVVVDLATGESWRRLHEHSSTKAETRPDLRMIVEGVEFLEPRLPDGAWETVVHDPRLLWPTRCRWPRTGTSTSQQISSSASCSSCATSTDAAR